MAARMRFILSLATLSVTLQAATAYAATVIVDNTDSGFSIITPSSTEWQTGTSTTPWPTGGDYRFALTTAYGGVFTEVEWRPNLPYAGTYEIFIWYGQGTNRATNAPFTVDHAGGSTPVYVNQQINGATWFSIGTYTFSAGTSGRVRLNNNADTRVVIADAVQFVETSPKCTLTMAVSPPGAGTTTPAAGGSYTKILNESVSITATANANYVFDRWTVSAGVNADYPYSAGTTITMDQDKTVTAVFISTYPPEFRAFWADAFHAGFKSITEIDSMIARAVQGNYNAIIPEVLAYQDNVGSGHGAYWNSGIVPKAVDIVGDIDPLAYMVQQAHLYGIEVHPWLVTYRVSTTWPPSGNAYLAAHPEYLMVPLANMGSIGTVGSKYVLDPGSPDVQEYLVNIVKELVTNYAIDGIHWDYIRYESSNAGYPTSTSYTKSGLARFKQITGYSGTPPYTGEASWDDFRRLEITELVRRVQAEIPLIKSNPRQPVRHSAALVTWGTAPADFHNSSAYKNCFCDWEYFLKMGYLDTGIPMNYFAESNNAMYRSWIDQEINWRNDRQIVSGPGIWLNTFANTLYQIEYARSAGLNGISTYSYAGTRSDAGSAWDWYPYAAANVFTTPAPTPPMPWRNPETASEGTLWGRVTDGITGQPLDNATVQVGSMSPVQTDGNGYYVVTMINASAYGTNYSVTAGKSGFPTVTYNAVAVIAGDVRTRNFVLGGDPPPTITLHPTAQSVCLNGTVQFTVAATGAGTLSYLWQKNGTNLTNGGHYSGVTSTTLTVSSVNRSDAASYQCVVSNASGDTASNPASLTTKTVTSILQNPSATSVSPGATAQFTVSAAGGGTLSYQWQKDGVNLTNGGSVAGAATATLSITGVSRTDLGYYRCLVTAECGSATTNTALLTVPADTNGDLRVDSVDFDAFSGCYNGPTNLVTGDCLKIDFNGDQYVDSIDFDVFSGCYNGPTNPPGCG